MSGDLKDRIERWLTTQGYPLEMEVAHIASEFGFDVSQSNYYKDIEENKYREIDVICSLGRGTPSLDYIAEYKIMIECKKGGGEQPWVIFGAKNDKSDPGLNLTRRIITIVANKNARSLLMDMNRTKELDRVFPDIVSEEYWGYGVTRGLKEAKDGKDIPYEAAMSAYKSAIDDVYGEDILANISQRFSIAVPVIVIDVPLFLVTYSSDKKVIVEQVEKGVLHWKKRVGNYSHASIYIVHKTEIKSFLEKCYGFAQLWIATPKTRLAELIKAEKAATSTSWGGVKP